MPASAVPVSTWDFGAGGSTAVNIGTSASFTADDASLLTATAYQAPAGLVNVNQNNRGLGVSGTGCPANADIHECGGEYIGFAFGSPAWVPISLTLENVQVNDDWQVWVNTINDFASATLFLPPVKKARRGA